MPNAKLCAVKISSFFLSLYANDMAPKWKSLIFPLWFGSQTLFFHSGLSKRNFWCKELSSKSKIVKVSLYFSLFPSFTCANVKKIGEDIWLFHVAKLWDFLICKLITSKQFFWPKIKDFALENWMNYITFNTKNMFFWWFHAFPNFFAFQTAFLNRKSHQLLEVVEQ